MRTIELILALDKLGYQFFSFYQGPAYNGPTSFVAIKHLYGWDQSRPKQGQDEIYICQLNGALLTVKKITEYHGREWIKTYRLENLAIVNGAIHDVKKSTLAIE